ncbi:MAG: hypothetical protein II075_01700 [Bacteroidales bacterium]|nr:hypothetical protein [Bacteroidales bacterium]
MLIFIALISTHLAATAQEGGGVDEYDAANPGTILDRMRDFIKTTLISDSDGKELRDGMDMTICCFDFAATD